MKTELFYLSLTAAFTGLLWVPYVLDRFFVRGILGAIGYPENPKPQSPWAQRLMLAHTNAVENLVVFAPLVLTAGALGLEGGLIASAAVLYFWARVVHAAAYTLKIPGVRTLAFVAGFAAQAMVAMSILAH